MIHSASRETTLTASTEKPTTLLLIYAYNHAIKVLCQALSIRVLLWSISPKKAV